MKMLAMGVIALAIGIGGVSATFATTFAAPESMTVTKYQFGLWIERITTDKAGQSWEVHRSQRDPRTFKERTLSTIDLVFRTNGGLEVSLDDGSKLVWETPTRLIQITPAGQRITRVSEFPILTFSPELFVVDRVILKAFLVNHGGTTFSVSALEGGELVKYTFIQAEERKPESGTTRLKVSRWGGSRPSHPAMYAQAQLVMTAPFDLLLSSTGDLLGWNDPFRDTVTVVQGLEPFSSVSQWQEKTISRPLFTTVTLAEKQMIPMADHVSLAATIMVPGDAGGKALPGPFPTVLIRTPYGRNGALGDAFSFVSRGYVLVSQDVRGRGDSGGVFQPFQGDVSEGNDTLDWIAAQPWSDGNVGMYGASYLGWVQWQAACSGNRHLKALVSMVPSSSAFGDSPYVNGMFLTGYLTWAVYVDSTPELAAATFKKDLNAIASERPLIDADLGAVGHEIPFWRSWVTHSSLDAYWQPGNILNCQQKIDQPVLHITGYYDDVLRGTMFAYDMMKANQRSNQQLIIGPWPHAINSVRSLAEFSFGPDSARTDLQYSYVRWFDHWLKGVDNKVETDPPVRYFTMGENKWHTADAWPPRNTVKKQWYLHSNGSAALPENDARLTMDKPNGDEPLDHYAHDPANPAPYIVDIRANQLAAPEDYQEAERRPDTLVYTTDVFKESFEITGDAEAVLYAATDRRDTDWVVRVTDVFPDGRSVNIIDGYLRARLRNGMAKEELVTPGAVLQYRIPMVWTSYRFAPGHRMRVIIASAAAGTYVVNTNTGNPMATDTQTAIAHQSVYHTMRYPSHIEVSVSEK
jgi:putative CocE/NonD family hydrolase